MKNNLKFIFALLISISLLLACDNKKDTSTTKTTSKNDNKPVLKDGIVGKYTFFYSETDGKIAVCFYGKGVDVGNKRLIYEDLLIVTTFAATINSISGFEDIEISSLGTQLKKMDTSDGLIRLVGNNCTYKIKFVTNGPYVTDFVYNKCN